ncbi:hypothetical protein ART_0063 [Arthrobacter sp. PAMC 25486]|nr:hypothetical protein ART_0063 [Arthrobacter sp. PAMC 25486]
MVVYTTWSMTRPNGLLQRVFQGGGAPVKTRNGFSLVLIQPGLL